MVKVDGNRVERFVLEIKPEHVGQSTLGLGRVGRHDVGRFYVLDADQDQRRGGPVDYIVDENPLTKAMKNDPSWLISFLDKGKRTIDHVVIKARTRDDARREAVELYLKNGDRAIYAGFVVTEEKHGGY